MKITLDTNILIRAHERATGTARQLLQIIAREHELVLSQSMLYELEEVCAYPRVRAITGITDAEVSRYIDFLVLISRLTDIGKPGPFALHDVDDWMVLRTAICGQVDILCTLDGDLSNPALIPLYERHGIRVMNDLELIELLRSHQ